MTKYTETLIAKLLRDKKLTQNKLANLLGVTQGRISQIATGREPISDAMAVRIAKELDLNPSTVLAQIHAERAQNDEVRNAWLKLAAGKLREIAIKTAGQDHENALIN